MIPMSNSSPTPQSGPPLPVEGWLDPGPKNAQLVYILYFVSLLIGVSILVGVVLAYMNRGKVGGYIDTHYTWLIRTFWIGLLYSVISVALMFVVIGVFIFIVVLIWFIVRLIKGLQSVGRGEPIANPESWLF